MISAFRQKSSDGASKGQGDLIQRFHGLSLAGVAPQVASEKSGYRSQNEEFSGLGQGLYWPLNVLALECSAREIVAIRRLKKGRRLT